MEPELSGQPRKAEARHAAEALLKSAGITAAPIRISAVLPYVKQKFDLTIRGTKERLPDGVYALTHHENNCVYIGYNETASVNRQKFSVAHELGHLFMGHLHGRQPVDLDSRDGNEIEANQFAAQLIMPSKMVRADIKAGLRDAKALQAKYEVSEEALWWRLQETGFLKLL